MTAVDIDQLTAAELEEIALRASEALHPEFWLSRILPGYVGAHGFEDLDEAEALFADHHREFWGWLWAVEPGVRSDSYVAVWARGGAKSTSAEMACVGLGARSKRRYGLYVCNTQQQADDHVQNVAGMLESRQVARWYPFMAERLVSKYGTSKGWRRNRLRTASGFTLDAIGLDTAARGVKLDEQRPDFLVVDDVDDPADGPKVVASKLDTITKDLIPAGAPDLVILAIQNLVHRDGVFARLVDGRARFLARRRVSGPIPALQNMTSHHEDNGTPGGRDVIDGQPTWVGQPLTRCQEMVDDMGLLAFIAECQHGVDRVEGALWTPEQLATLLVPLETIGEQVRIVVAIDPSGGHGADNDAQGIIVAGRDANRRGWVLDDRTCSLAPHGWGDQAVAAHADWDADAFVAEINYGGEMVVDVLRSAIERAYGTVVASSDRATAHGRMYTITAGGRQFDIHVVTASRGKRVRAEPAAALYGRPDEPDTWSTATVHHAGHFPPLETEMTTWRPDAAWSPNRVDALVWAFADLFGAAPKRRPTIVGGSTL